MCVQKYVIIESITRVSLALLGGPEGFFFEGGWFGVGVVVSRSREVQVAEESG